jgi:hypothetical protein
LALPAILNKIVSDHTFMADLNPQPLPPKTIAFDDFVESTTQAMLRAVQAQSVRSATNVPLRPPRIIIGIIAEPNAELSQVIQAE